MILNRLLLRIAAVTALSNYQEEPFPTLAGKHVFDSRIDPVATLHGHDLYPICVVYSDYDKDSLSFKNMRRKDRSLTLTFELFCGQIEEHGQDEFVVTLPQTDSEIEMTLDLLEDEIYHGLTASNLASDTFNTIAYGIENVISRRGASYEGGQKLAARQVTMETTCLKDPTPGLVPDYARDFLAELENRGEYQTRVPAIRAALERGASCSDAEKAIKAGGLPRLSGHHIGYQTGPVATLGPIVKWLDSTGAPLG